MLRDKLNIGRLAEEAEDRIGWDRLVRPSTSTETQIGAKERRFGAETGRPLGRYSVRNIFGSFSRSSLMSVEVLSVLLSVLKGLV